MVCVVCPVGCEMEVREEDTRVVVEGNRCLRGVEYARSEVTDPRRTLTTTLPVQGGDTMLVPVRVDHVPQDRMLALMDRLRGMTLDAPVKAGATIAVLILGGEELEVVATASVGRPRGPPGTA